MLLRNDNRRTFELSNLFILKMYNQKFIKCFAMIIVMNNEKMNKIERIKYDFVIRHVNSLLVWPSSWIRTLFFNPIQFDEQNPKPSLRVRTSELVQDSGSDKTWYSSQSVGQNCLFSSVRRAKLTVQPTVWEPNPRFLYEPKFGLSARRTSMSVRFNSSDKSPSSSNPPGQKPQFVRFVRTKTSARPTRSGEKGMSNPAQP
jgi:hypothetical protein